MKLKHPSVCMWEGSWVCVSLLALVTMSIHIFWSYYKSIGIFSLMLQSVFNFFTKCFFSPNYVVVL